MTVDYGPLVAEKIFNFTLGFVSAVDKDGNPVEAGYTIPENGNKAQLTIPAGGTNGTVDFGEITFVKAGTYTFEAKETAEDEEGITYDATVWTLTLKVVDHDNDLQVDEVTYVAGDKTSTTQASFTNPYKPEPTEYVPPVVKRIIGEPTVEDLTFNFTLEANEDYAGAKVNNGSTSITVPTGQTGEDIVGRFEQIDFTMAGTYSFTVKEIKEDLEGITYDETVYTLTVVVEDMDGYLEVKSAVFEAAAAADTETNEPTEGEPETEKQDAALFINAYQPTPTEFTPEATKFVTGQPRVKAETFKFTLTAADAKEEGSYWMDEGEQTFITTGDYWDKTLVVEPGEVPEAGVPAGIVTFDEITYMKSGTYTYTVVEQKGSATGWTYSEDVWTITVKVVDEGGHLVKYVSYKLNGTEVTTGEDETVMALSFTNNYVPTPTAYIPPVVKRIVGEPTVEDMTFNFELTPDSENPDGASLRETDKTSIVVPAGKTGEDIEGSFSEITFTMAGTYRFTATEVKETLEGVTYDETVYTLTVKVVDHDGTLTVDSAVFTAEPADAEHSATDAALFINPYQPAPTDYTPEATKFVTGQKRQKKETFAFTLTANETVKDGSYWMNKDNETIIASGDTWRRTLDVQPGEPKVAGDPVGTVVFDKITYTKAGTYTYTVVEEKGTATSWEYSKDVWTIIVEVVDKNGKLEKNVSYKLNGATFTVGGNGKTLPLSFTNVYKPGVHTGDNTDTRPFVFAMGISGMLLLGLGAFGVKNRKKGKKGA